MTTLVLLLAIWPFSSGPHWLTILDTPQTAITQMLTNGAMIPITATPCPRADDTFAWIVSPSNGGSVADYRQLATMFTMGKKAVTVWKSCAHPGE